jgi:hypothetical protein
MGHIQGYARFSGGISVRVPVKTEKSSCFEYRFDSWRSAAKYRGFPRPSLKNDKTPKQRILFHCAALKIFEIHRVFPQMFAPSGEKISRRCAFRHLSNKA